MIDKIINRLFNNKKSKAFALLLPPTEN